jgi:hypothetical protein
VSATIPFEISRLPEIRISDYCKVLSSEDTKEYFFYWKFNIAGYLKRDGNIETTVGNKLLAAENK